MSWEHEQRQYLRRLFQMAIHKMELEVEEQHLSRQKAEIELETAKLVKDGVELQVKQAGNG